MSIEYYDKVRTYHNDLAENFAANEDGIKRIVEVYIEDKIYVYLWEENVFIQTQKLPIPKRWFDKWPTEKTIKNYIHRNAIIGSVPIVDMEY